MRIFLFYYLEVFREISNTHCTFVENESDIKVLFCAKHKRTISAFREASEFKNKDKEIHCGRKH